MRTESPLQGLFRVATRDMELGGVKIAKGDTLWLSLAAANRDPEVFENADDNGRIAVLGDAAHAQTPMTGAGFEEAVADAAALAEALGGAEDDARGALERYEFARLTGMRARVSAGQSFSRSFAAV